ncbi:hypothetical protein GALL_184180 [mine drainage metagenome]|uniref:Uncharacterized protein n=1 Tax=mine drainage metagenome TaxID=410659 RepID=A0A1J5RUQ9_9ZZZZ
MNLSDTLSLTPKGVDEALNRTYKVNIRQRSVLILLGKPQTVEYVLQKQQQLFNRDEVIQIVNELAGEGFVDINGGTVARAAASLSSGSNIQLLEGIIISEAKFLLVDFCVDSFGTQSQTFVDELGGCKNEKNLQLCLKNIYAATEANSPDRLSILLKIIEEINATA